MSESPRAAFFTAAQRRPGTVVLECERVDLRRVLTEAIEQTRVLMEARQHRLHVSTPPELPVVMGDGKRLVQAARGYVATIVSGAVAFRDGEPTGSLRGGLVRGAQPTPAR
mgnify:CR=1 FL=1